MRDEGVVFGAINDFGTDESDGVGVRRSVAGGFASESGSIN